MRTRFILLPGLGTDSTLLEPQKAAFPDLEVPDLPEHLPGESFRDYCVRFVTSLGTDVPFVIGGISFGGFVAQEALRDPEVSKNCRGVILIASCRTAKAVVGAIRMHRLAGQYVPDPLAEWGLRHIFAPMICWLNHVRPDRIRMIMKMAQKSSVSYIRWGAKCSVDWDFAGAKVEYPEIPVKQMHGGRDRLFPFIHGDPDVVIPEAGHLVNVTYPEIVNEFLANSLAEFTRAAATLD